MTGKILVVDGSATSRITLKVRLAAACYDPLTARTGAEAIEVVARQHPSLVLIGGAPGDMDAVELCARIVAAWPGLPVMVNATADRRLAALRAGAAAILDAPMDEMNLFARLRGLMRDHADDETPAAAQFGTADAALGMAETQAVFETGSAVPAPVARSVMLIAESMPAAVAWRAALAGRIDAQLHISDVDRALAEAAIGMAPDLYLIAGDIAQPGDGLRLLSELRSRRASRHAALAVALREERMDMMSVALDLGAGDVLPASLLAPGAADESALRLTSLLRRKRADDQHRAVAEHERSLARIDALTGLPNRRYALPRLHEFCEGGLDAGRRCAVVAVDIDRFKAVNDRHGHAAGDAVLAEVAARLKRLVPAPGFVARMGGEEFLVVLPDTGPGEAAALAECLREAVSAFPIALPSRHGETAAVTTLRVTVSAGLASLACRTFPELSGKAAALLAEADDALMRAKRSGRDRVIVSRLDAVA